MRQAERLRAEEESAKQEAERLRAEEESARQQAERLRIEKESAKQEAERLRVEKRKQAYVLRARENIIRRQLDRLHIKARRTSRHTELLIAKSNDEISKMRQYGNPLLTAGEVERARRGVSRLEREAMRIRWEAKLLRSKDKREHLSQRIERVNLYKKNLEGLIKIRQELDSTIEKLERLRKRLEFIREQEIARARERNKLLERIKAAEETSRRLASEDTSSALSKAADEAADVVRETVGAPASPAAHSNSYILIVPIFLTLVALICGVMVLRTPRDNQPNIPQFANSLIRILSPKRDAENIIGDLQEELVIIVKKSGPFKARIWLYKQTFISACPLIYSSFMQLARRLTKSLSRL